MEFEQRQLDISWKKCGNLFSSEQWEVNGENMYNKGMYGLYQLIKWEQGADFCLCKRTLRFSSICEQIRGKLMHIPRDVECHSMGV